MNVGRGDEVIHVRMGFLAHQVDSVSVTAQRTYDGACPEVAAGPLEQITVQYADQTAPSSL